MKLSPAMETALGTIAQEEVTYLFAPLKPSKTRITTADVTPHFSHGLLARTVFALERAGRVQLVPWDMQGGRVLPVHCWEQNARQDQQCALLIEHGGAWHEARINPGEVGDAWPTDQDLFERYAAGEAI